LIPLTAAFMNLLAVAASFGLVVAVFQWDGAAPSSDLVRTDRVVPTDRDDRHPLRLSMDYQVFLVSRMHEEW